MRFLCEQLLNCLERGIHVNVIDCQKIKPINRNECGYYKASFKSRFLPSRIAYALRKHRLCWQGILNASPRLMRAFDAHLPII
jgi:hypothetical protein